MTLVGAHARDLDGTVGAEGGNDVVAPTVVKRVGVGGHGGTDALDDVGVVHWWAQ